VTPTGLNADPWRFIEKDQRKTSASFLKKEAKTFSYEGRCRTETIAL
jgi:hypothetical protein